ncbi:MAG: TfoX/Sxy family protein [Rhodoferax sp.]|uniref:TfoX/Sxy family protein n=1 Tax=Rhodoferax sp. TaxID=50421 RepID=UPI002612C215|nr:TfoX/Sxy family protein [Rhodoferax sp.]MDD5335286.1 TfoX/Sxy family protein [Rhodoferax sp.]
MSTKPISAPEQRVKSGPATLPATHAATELQELANLGPKSAAAGIRSFQHLAQLGAIAAYVMTKRSGAKVSLNLLWAIEGALTGVPWQTVAREQRTSLLLALETHESDLRQVRSSA